MQATIGVGNALALFVAMAVLAAVPSVSVLAVSARAASSGFAHGALTAAGIVLGDLLFILLAVFGLALLAETLGPAFIWVKLAAGVYLLWLAVLTWRHESAVQSEADPATGRWSSFMVGLLITLGDQKAVLFYLGFLPAFVDLVTLDWMDIGIIAAVTVLAVGGVKLGYAYAAARLGRGTAGRMGKGLSRLAALLMFAAGILLILRA